MAGINGDAPQSSEVFDQDTLARIGRLSLRARRIVEGVRTGAHRSPFHGASVEFAEHKEYTPGDDLRRLDWKHYGKSDKYYVKRFEEETNLLAYLLFDTSASMGYGRLASSSRSWWQRLTGGGRPAGGEEAGSAGHAAGGELEATRTKHDYAMLLAASLAYLLVSQGDAVGLQTFGGGDARFLPPRTRSSHLHTLMGTLVNTRPGGTGQIAQALNDFAPRVRQRSVIVLISDLLEDPEEVLHAMKSLRTRRNDVIVFQVLHSDEITFPYDEVSQFEDPEDRTRLLVTDPREMRQGYLAELKEFLELVRRRCFEAQIDHRLLDTSLPVSRALAEFLAGRAAGGGKRG